MYSRYALAVWRARLPPLPPKGSGSYAALTKSVLLSRPSHPRLRPPSPRLARTSMLRVKRLRPTSQWYASSWEPASASHVMSGSGESTNFARQRRMCKPPSRRFSKERDA